MDRTLGSRDLGGLKFLLIPGKTGEKKNSEKGRGRREEKEAAEVKAGAGPTGALMALQPLTPQAFPRACPPPPWPHGAGSGTPFLEARTPPGVSPGSHLV